MNAFYSMFNLVSSWSQYIDQYLSNDSDSKSVLKNVFSIISTVLWVVLGIVGAVGAVYAIYLGVRLARADEQGKRDDAKKHLITVCIAVGVTLALILVFNTFLPMLISAFKVAPAVEGNGNGGGNVPGLIRPLLALVKA